MVNIDHSLHVHNMVGRMRNRLDGSACVCVIFCWLLPIVKLPWPYGTTQSFLLYGAGLKGKKL